MTDSELSALLEAEQSSALGYMGGELSAARSKAMDYYLAEPFGNEVAGRSQVVSSDVADTIEWMLPSLMKMFMAGDDVVSFEPQGKEDEEGAKQATEYNNHVFLRDNDGFRVFYCMFKDALLQRTGTCKVYPEFSESEELDEFIDVPDDQYAITSFAKQEENAKVAEDYKARGWKFDDEKLWYLKEHTETPVGVDPMTGNPIIAHSGVWCRTVKRMKICVEPVPPEEMLVSKRTRGDIDEPAYMAHRTQKTASELIEQGYSKSKVDSIPSDAPEKYSSEEATARDRDLNEDVTHDHATANKAMRLIWVTEAYIKVDWDDDGIAEMRRVVHAGPGCNVLENEEWDGPRPFAIISPIIIPHRLIGRSIADQTMEFQLLSSTLWRQILDNLYLTNNPMKYVDPTRVNIDDLLQPRVGGIIRPPQGENGAGFSPDAIVPIVVEPVAAASFPMLEYINSVRENRTGVTKYNQGTDADSLNKTARGISQIMSASQQRIELIARVFAEGVKRIFKLQHHYLRRYPDLAKRAIRLRNKEWVEMDPASWGNDFDLQINVGLGTGNKDQMLMHLTGIMAVQEKLVMMQQGVDGPFVTPQNIHNSATKLVENSGFKNAEEFFTDPTPKPGQPPRQQKPKPPPPEMIKVQAQIEGDKAKLQMEGQKAVAGHQLEIERFNQIEKPKADADLALKDKELQLKDKELELKDREMAMREQEMHHETRRGEMEMDGQLFDMGTKREESGMKREAHDSKLANDQMSAELKSSAPAKGKTNGKQAPAPQQTQGGPIAQILKALVDNQAKTAELIAQGNSQVVAAITAPRTSTMKTPDGRTYTAQTATAQ